MPVVRSSAARLWQATSPARAKVPATYKVWPSRTERVRRRAVVAVRVGGAAGDGRPARAVPAGQVGGGHPPVGHGEVAAHVDALARDGDRVHRAVEAGAHRLPAAPVPHRDALIGVVRRPGHAVGEVAAEIDPGPVHRQGAASGGSVGDPNTVDQEASVGWRPAPTPPVDAGGAAGAGEVRSAADVAVSARAAGSSTVPSAAEARLVSGGRPSSMDVLSPCCMAVPLRHPFAKAAFCRGKSPLGRAPCASGEAHRDPRTRTHEPPERVRPATLPTLRAK